MRWPWRRDVPDPVEPGTSPGLDQAVEATEKAEQDLKRAREKRQDVDKVVSSLRRLRDEDPLASLFLESMKGNRRRPDHGQ